jgi:hypothetical protein
MAGVTVGGAAVRDGRRVPEERREETDKWVRTEFKILNKN